MAAQYDVQAAPDGSVKRVFRTDATPHIFRQAAASQPPGLPTARKRQERDNPCRWGNLRPKPAPTFFPIEALQPYQFDGQNYVSVRKLLDFEAHRGKNSQADQHDRSGVREGAPNPIGKVLVACGPFFSVAAPTRRRRDLLAKLVELQSL